MEKNIQENTPTNEDIQTIIKNNNITIPASILFTLLQYTEVSVTRGAIKANELSRIGYHYDLGTKMLNELINVKLNTPIEITNVNSTVTTEVPKKTKKTKKKIIDT
jgi:regulatory protein YycI of two-component signal transduction system YycFG